MVLIMVSNSTNVSYVVDSSLEGIIDYPPFKYGRHI